MKRWWDIFLKALGWRLPEGQIDLHRIPSAEDRERYLLIRVHLPE